MTGPTIDLLLAGPESDWLKRALEGAGARVVVATPSDDLELVGDILIIDQAWPEFRTWCIQYQGIRVVVGWEELSVDRDAFELRAFFSRPVATAQLLEALSDVLDQDRLKPVETGGRPTAPAPPAIEYEPVELGPLGPDAVTPVPGSVRPKRSSSAPEAPEIPAATSSPINPDSRDQPQARDQARDRRDQPPPREQTIQLDDSAENMFSVVVARETNRSSTGALDAPEGNPDLEILSDSSSAALSHRLVVMLRAADQRLFPGEDPLDLSFPIGEERAEELVPDEMLAEVAMPLDLNPSDPLEAFTFVGTPDLLDTGASRQSSVEMTPHTVNDPRLDPNANDQSHASVTDLTREGLLPAGGALRMLWQLRNNRSTRLHLEFSGGTNVFFSLERGEVVEMGGPVYLRLAAKLRRDGILATLATTEEESQILIDRAVDQGRLDPFFRDQALRQQRQALITELCRASECQFSLGDVNPASTTPLLNAPIVAVATEGLRAELKPRDALRWLGIKANSRLWLAPAFDTLVRDARLEPEVVAALRRASGGSVGSFLGSLAACVGAPGVLLSLGLADALRFEAGEFELDTPNALRARVEQAHALALNADYFRVLGVSRDASARQIEDATREQRRALGVPDLHALGLEDLEGPRQEALEAIEDAYDILRQDRLRAVYAAGLGEAPNTRT